MTDQDTQVTPEGLFQTDDNQQKSDEITLSQDEIQKIVKQNLNAQEHIKRLESETKQYREQLSELQNELSKSRTIDELLEGIQQQNETPGPTAPQINKDELLNELKAEVFRDLSAAQQAALEEQNAAEAVRAAQERYGEGYKSYVQERATDLGVSLEQMEQYAKTSPKVFMELLGGQKVQTPTPTMGNQTLPPNQDTDIEATYKKVATLRLMNTPEGIEARRLWESNEFQAKYRQHILDKAEKQGS